MHFEYYHDLNPQVTRKGHVHHLVSGGVRSKDGLPLLHPNAYYTLNEIPKK